MDADQQSTSPTTASQFVADNEKFRMVDAAAALTSGPHLHVSAAFVDAFGVATLADHAENGEVRLLVDYELSEIPAAQDTLTLEDARTRCDTSEDPRDRTPRRRAFPCPD